MTATTVLPAALHVAMPWRNGGGVTRQVAVHPAEADLATFAWRISMADVHGTASFSGLPGVDRILVILHGVLDLDLPGRSFRLTEDSAACAFPGDVAAVGHARGGAVTDLNVMVRRGMASAKVRRAEGCMMLRTATALLVAAQPLRVTTSGDTFALDRHDGLHWEGRSGTPIDVAGGTGWLVEIADAMT